MICGCPSRSMVRLQSREPSRTRCRDVIRTFEPENSVRHDRISLRLAVIAAGDRSADISSNPSSITSVRTCPVTVRQLGERRADLRQTPLQQPAGRACFPELPQRNAQREQRAVRRGTEFLAEPPHKAVREHALALAEVREQQHRRGGIITGPADYLIHQRAVEQCAAVISRRERKMMTVESVEMARILIHEAERTRRLKITLPYRVNPQPGGESLPDEFGHLIGGADLFLRWWPAVNCLINRGLQGEHLADSCRRAPDLDRERIFVLLIPGLEHPWQVVGAS